MIKLLCIIIWVLLAIFLCPSKRIDTYVQQIREHEQREAEFVSEKMKGKQVMPTWKEKHCIPFKKPKP